MFKLITGLHGEFGWLIYVLYLKDFLFIHSNKIVMLLSFSNAYDLFFWWEYETHKSVLAVLFVTNSRHFNIKAKGSLISNLFLCVTLNGSIGLGSVIWNH